MKVVGDLVDRIERESYGGKPEWEVLSVINEDNTGTYLIKVKKVETNED